jgi:L,D-transpeptidase ErfK/SrfK
MARAMDAVAQYKKQQKSTPAIDWGRVRQVVDARWIVPMPISVGAPSLNRIIAAIRPEKYDFAPYGIEANDASPPNAPR